MTAQPIKGLGNEVITACYIPANHSQNNAVKTLSIKEPAEAQKDKEGRG